MVPCMLPSPEKTRRPGVVLLAHGSRRGNERPRRAPHPGRGAGAATARAERSGRSPLGAPPGTAVVAGRLGSLPAGGPAGILGLLLVKAYSRFNGSDTGWAHDLSVHRAVGVRRQSLGRRGPVRGRGHPASKKRATGCGPGILPSVYLSEGCQDSGDSDLPVPPMRYGVSRGTVRKPPLSPR